MCYHSYNRYKLPLMSFGCMLQTNIFHVTNNGLVRCFSKYKMTGRQKDIKIDTHGITVDQIHFITQNKKIIAEWSHSQNTIHVANNNDEFKSNLYNQLHTLDCNLITNTPDEIAPEEEHILRIDYSFTNDLNMTKIIKDGKCVEVFCMPSFPTIQGYSEKIETIYVHKEDKVVFAPGILTKKAKIGQKIFVTNITQHITHLPFVIANFKITDISYNNIKCKIFTPLLYNIEPELKNDINLVCQHVADNFLMEEMNIKIVFMYSEQQTMSENSIFLPMSIFPMAGIDQNMHVRVKICEFIAKMLTVKLDCQDFWLDIGFKEYIKNSLLRCIFGENEIQFKSKEDLEYVIKNDIYQPSLIKEKNKYKRSNLHKYYNYNFEDTDYFKMVKARLIFGVLENNLSRAFMEKIIYNILKMTTINTSDFIRIIRDISGYDMASFFQYYVYRPGLIDVHLKFEKDKKGKVDVYMTQQGTSKRRNANKKLFGEFLFKVFEQEGVFEYKFTGDKLSFQCHFRTKKRKTEKEMLEAQKLQGKFIEVLENTDEDEHYNMQSQILFMRADPNFHMLARFFIEQPDFMYIEQLILEKSVYAQIDAIDALSTKISTESIQALERILNDTHIFYKVRIYILHMFSNYVVERGDSRMEYTSLGENIINFDFGYQKIIQNFIKKFCIPGSTIPKANDFIFMSTYFIQKNSTSALASADPESKKVFSDRVVKAKNITSAFLANILRFNSTEESIQSKGNFDKFMDQNYVSHGNYLSAIIENISYQLCSKSHLELEPLIEELERLKVTDLVFPSYQNLITASILKTYLNLSFYGFVKLNMSAMIQYADKNNFISVREAAYEILCVCFLNDCFEFIKKAIKTDEKHVKLYILNTLKKILQLKDGRFYDNEEYKDAFNSIADIDVNYQQKFNYKARYAILFENHLFFYEILQEYYYDNIMMEVLTDIIYLIHDKVYVYRDDEEIITLEQDTFIVKMKINITVNIRWPEGLKHEFRPEVKKSEDTSIKETIIKEKSKYIISFTKLDTILIQYDETLYKYYNMLIEYKRRQNTIKSKDCKSQSVSVDLFDNLNVNSAHNSADFVGDDNITMYNGFKKIDNYNNDSKSLTSLKPADQSNFIIKKILMSGKLNFEEFVFNDFFIHVINKTIKKHKYYSKLNLRILNNMDANEYKSFLHKQFSEFYLTQKYGSHLYLNAKALENVVEGTYLEYGLFEPYIYIGEELRLKCEAVIQAILLDSRSVYFTECIESSQHNLQNYNDIIRIPIHIDLIKQRLSENKMVFLETFIHYIELVFLNSMEYNDIESEIYKIAKSMLAKSQKLICTMILSKLMNNEDMLHDNSEIFTEELFLSSTFMMNNSRIISSILQHKKLKNIYSVLESILNELMTLKESSQYIAPNTSYEYLRIIKKPMCIEKMLAKIIEKEYVSIGHVLNDMNQIIKNCIAFNGNSSWVVRVAKKMENHLKREIALTFGTRYIISNKKNENAASVK